MTHSARPIATPVANIVFCCFVFLDLKSGGRRHTRSLVCFSSLQNIYYKMHIMQNVMHRILCTGIVIIIIGFI